MISKTIHGVPLAPRRISILTGSILLLLSSGFVQNATAVDGTWINNDNTGTNWSDTTNWLGGVITDGIDSTASLVHFPTYNITGATTDIGSTYTLDSARTL